MSEIEDRRPYTFDRVVRIIFSICAVIAVLFVLNLLKGVLLPFLVACLIAYMLEPIVKWNKKWTHLNSRFIPVILTLIEASAVFAAACYIVIPYLITEATEMTDLLKRYATTQIHIPYLSESIHAWIRDNINFNELARLISREEWMAIIKKTLAGSWSFLSSGMAVIIGILSWLIVILYVIFIMLDYERLSLSFRQLVPHAHRRRVFRIFDDVKNAMNRYFRGQSLIALLVGILFSIGFCIIDLPMGIMFGLFIGVLNMVPYLQLISLPIAAVLCIVASVTDGVGFWQIFWETMAVYVIVQCIQDLVLTPRIMGRAMGLNPAIILLSLSIWGSLLGFMGLIIALPLTTLILSYYDMYVIQRVQQKDRLRALRNNFHDSSM
ncbi:MAG: AI-2E family transporter [Muribaculaceae bacterium]|nr:AI-2E family transporter [Muribaculaceae bacterium]